MEKIYYMQYGLIHSKYLGCIIDEPAIIFDSEANVALKLGDYRKVKDYYDKVSTTPLGPSLVLVKLSEYNNFDKEELRVILNYFATCSGVPERVKWFLENPSEEELKNWVKKMKDIGY